MDPAWFQCVLLGGILLSLMVQAVRKPRQSKPSRLEEILEYVYGALRKMSAQSDALIAAVQQNTAITAQVVAALAADVSAGGSSADLQPLVDQLTANNAALTKALGSGQATGAIVITPTTVNANVGATPAPLSASGGTGPYTFSTSTPFSTGAALNADGSFTAPTTVGTDTLDVTATDSTGATGSATVVFSVPS